MARGQHLAALVDDLEDVEAERAHAGVHAAGHDLGRVVVEVRVLGQLQQDRLHQAIVGVGQAGGGLLDVAAEAVVLVGHLVGGGVERAREPAAVLLGDDDARHRRQRGDGD